MTGLDFTLMQANTRIQMEKDLVKVIRLGKKTCRQLPQNGDVLKALHDNLDTITDCTKQFEPSVSDCMRYQIPF